MPDIRLQDYSAKIKGLIQSNRYDEALAHCQHILRYYPKYIETYSLMGEACLEKEMYREAIEFFQRTLSADPENLIARVGLGIIYDGQGALPEAIWQLERAFELAPGNTEVRRELQRLYAQHEGGQKTRLKLTRGALARLYSRNGLYERAVGEYQGILRQDRDLPDIRVALVEALWREGRRLEVVETCLELLEALPNCLKANLILGEIWLRGGNEDAGREKLNVARALDPENLVAQELMGKDSPLAAEIVLIPELEAMPETLGLVGRETAAPAPARWGIEEEIAKAPVEAAVPGEAEEELPAWLRDVGVVPEGEPGLEVAGEEPVLEAEPEEAFPMGEVPDWLKELMGEEAQPPAGEPEAIGEEAAVEEALPVGEVPEWLEQLERAEKGEVTAQAMAEEAPSAEVPPAGAALGGVAAAGALLAATVAGEHEREAATPETEAVEPEAAPAEVAVAAEEVAGEKVAAEEVPEWLQSLATEEVPPVVTEAMPLPAEGAVEPAEEIPDWLQALEIPEVEEAAPATAARILEETTPKGEIPASLQALVDAGILDEKDLGVAMAEMSAEDLEAQRAEEVPAWLQELVGSEEEHAAIKAVPMGEAQSVAEAPAPGEKEEAPEEELPAWLQALADLEAKEEIAPAVELPVEPVPPVEEAVLPAIEAPVEEALVVGAAVLPSVEAPVERERAVEEEMPQVVSGPAMEAAVVEEEVPPVVEMPAAAVPVAELMPLAEEVPAAEEEIAPVAEMPVEEVPPAEEMVTAEEVARPEVAEQVALASRKEGLLEQVKARPRDYRARVDLAQAYGEERNWTAALAQYEKLVSARKFLPEVLHDLEQLVEEDVDRARLYQLMGDIYMQQDQLDKALESYRLARQSLGRSR